MQLKEQRSLRGIGTSLSNSLRGMRSIGSSKTTKPKDETKPKDPTTGTSSENSSVGTVEFDLDLDFDARDPPSSKINLKKMNIKSKLKAKAPTKSDGQPVASPNPSLEKSDKIPEDSKPSNKNSQPVASPKSAKQEDETPKNDSQLVASPKASSPDKKTSESAPELNALDTRDPPSPKINLKKKMGFTSKLRAQAPKKSDGQPVASPKPSLENNDKSPEDSKPSNNISKPVASPKVREEKKESKSVNKEAETPKNESQPLASPEASSSDKKTAIEIPSPKVYLKKKMNFRRKQKAKAPTKSDGQPVASPKPSLEKNDKSPEDSKPSNDSSQAVDSPKMREEKKESKNAQQEEETPKNGSQQVASPKASSSDKKTTERAREFKICYTEESLSEERAQEAKSSTNDSQPTMVASPEESSPEKKKAERARELKICYTEETLEERAQDEKSSTNDSQPKMVALPEESSPEKKKAERARELKICYTEESQEERAQEEKNSKNYSQPTAAPSSLPDPVLSAAASNGETEEEPSEDAFIKDHVERYYSKLEAAQQKHYEEREYLFEDVPVRDDDSFGDFTDAAFSEIEKTHSRVVDIDFVIEDEEMKRAAFGDDIESIQSIDTSITHGELWGTGALDCVLLAFV